MSACIAVVLAAFFSAVIIAIGENGAWMCDICLGQD